MRLQIGTVIGLSSVFLLLLCYLKYRQHKEEQQFKVKQETKIERAKYIGYERAENFSEMEQWREFNDDSVSTGIG